MSLEIISAGSSDEMILAIRQQKYYTNRRYPILFVQPPRVLEFYY